MKYTWLLGVLGGLLGMTSRTSAQSYLALRINEVIADNETQNPADVIINGVGGARADMVELYNTGSEAVELGTSAPGESLALTDTPTLSVSPTAWTFPQGTTILPGGFLVVFCDSDSLTQGSCELHTDFGIASDGTEPLTLWGPETQEDGKTVRRMIDQVWLPPLSADVSFGRFPDGAGPAPVPLSEVLDTFRFYPQGTSTLGVCTELPVDCAGNLAKKRFCQGAPNASMGGNVAPHVHLVKHSSNNPAAGESVKLRVKVDDEKGPETPNIAQVELVYKVNGGAEQRVGMIYDVKTGVQQTTYDCNGSLPGGDQCPNPFDLFTFWDGQIPGQLAGAVVEFYLSVVDAQGASDTSPDLLCPAGVGPCDRDFGGPGCSIDVQSSSCDPPRAGLKYVACRTPFRYKVAATARPEIASVVINEVVANQDGILIDVTEPACIPADMCGDAKPDCCKSREDFLELFNNSQTTVSLAGLWLSDGPFNPQVWQFPPGSKIAPREHLIVWLDRDGGKCPDDMAMNKPCFWECPDPNNPAMQEYHANFALNASEDDIYLFDTEANGFGVVHGVEFTGLSLNHSLALLEDGDRNGCWIAVQNPTPGESNLGKCLRRSFLRGDADGNCSVDLTDAVFTLNYLFTGGKVPQCPDAADSDDNGRVELTDAVYTLGYLFLGSRPPPLPGVETAGIDPTIDELGTCNPPRC